MFSNSCEYGLRAILFTAKVLQKLTRNKLVKSIKGPYGGFIIEKDKMDTITLRELVKIFDGETVYTRCGLGLSDCNEKLPCPIHHKFKEIREDLKNMLENSTLSGLLHDLDADLLRLKR